MSGSIAVGKFIIKLMSLLLSDESDAAAAASAAAPAVDDTARVNEAIGRAEAFL
jgi:hypothetical protein